jgi:hypothetical protein
MKKMRREREKMVVMSTERSRNGWMELEMDAVSMCMSVSITMIVEICDMDREDGELTRMQ